jgi:serine/threonine-protein kinase
MELVEGDDLATLLHLVGRFPGDKALDLARQICAGVAAAHACGVVHRDLKPANVLVDRRGRAHVADFGLALAGAASGAEAYAGSPGYMAPEQLAGREATVRSDLFALGAVLYELFTGRRAFRADSLPELRRLVEEGPPPRPSELVPGVDPAVERVIMRCLDREPANRPASALAIAAALPGGDPLAAALAAGETPSPELVAASGGEGTLAALPALTLAGSALLLALVAAFAVSSSQLVRFMPLDKPPAYLDERARELLVTLGHRELVTATVAAWSFDPTGMRYLEEHGKGPARWRPLASGRVPTLWRFYRQNPEDFQPRSGFSTVQRNQPPLHVPGEAQVDLDPEGRLFSLVVVPPERAATAIPPVEPPWRLLFDAAALPQAAFRPVPPEWTPPVAVDRRAAWVGEAPELPGVPLRLEAGAYRGSIVWLRTVGPWTQTVQERIAGRRAGERFADALNAALWLLMLAGVLVARRNLKLGRGDRRGALRVAGWFFAAHTLVWMGQADHAHSLQGEWFIIQRDFGYNLFLAGLLWLGYVAVEPYLRRQWPETMVSWSRLLAGRGTDPRVGRDVLIGLVLGGLETLGDWSLGALPAWSAGQPIPPRWPSGDGYLLDLVDQVVHATLEVMLLTFALLFFLFVLRRRFLAIGAMILLFSVLVGAQAGPAAWLSAVPAALLGAIIVIGLTRFGLLATAVGAVLSRLLVMTPWTAETSAWYAWQTWVGLALVVGAVAWGWRTVRAGQPLLVTALES